VEPIRERVAQGLEERERARRAAMDPAMGARLPDPTVGATARDVSPTAVRVIIFGGNLSSCCTGAVDEPTRHVCRIAREAGGRQTGVVLVLHGSASAAQRFVKQYQAPYRVIADNDGRLADAYNAFWTPRAYVVAGGRLAWIQKQGPLDFNELAEALRAAGAAKAKPTQQAAVPASR
jgi:hypothetical protein